MMQSRTYFDGLLSKACLDIVDDPLTHNRMRYKVITSKLLRKYILATAKVMMATIAARLSNNHCHCV
jgi:hypothetical protein